MGTETGYKAVITTDDAPERAVTIYALGIEAWATADSIIRVLEGNDAKFSVRVWRDGQELNWVEELNRLNLSMLASFFEDEVGGFARQAPE